jgi:Zn-dependent metalloprotease
MKIYFKPYVLLSCLISGFFLSSLYAANVHTLWGNEAEYDGLLRSFYLKSSEQLASLSSITSDRPLSNSFIQLTDNKGIEDVRSIRMQQAFQGISIWGVQLIYHPTSNKYRLTGKLVTEIDDDLKERSYILSEQSEKDIVRELTGTNQSIQIAKVIYIDSKHNHQAQYAYHLTTVSLINNQTAHLHFIINGYNGDIIKQWNNLKKAQTGVGKGGVSFNSLIYRQGSYTFGMLSTNGQRFGKLFVSSAKSRFFVHFQTSSLKLLV